MKFRALLLASLFSSCALLKSTPEETPPEAPNAKSFRSLPPGARDEVFPPPQIYLPADYLNRLVCANGDPPATRLANHKGLVATYEIQCPNEVSVSMTLDTAIAPPPPPKGERLLSEKSFPEYRDAIGDAEKKDFKKMLADLDAALKITPGEPAYRRERIYALYSNGRALEALLDADDLLKEVPTAQTHRYRALAALQLGMRDAVMQSLDGIISLTKAGNPMYAEAICTKGILLSRSGDAAGEAFVQQGCALEFQACCDEIKAREKKVEEPAAEEPATLPDEPLDAGPDAPLDAGLDVDAGTPDAGSEPAGPGVGQRAAVLSAPNPE